MGRELVSTAAFRRAQTVYHLWLKYLSPLEAMKMLFAGIYTKPIILSLLHLSKAIIEEWSGDLEIPIQNGKPLFSRKWRLEIDRQVVHWK